MPQSVFPCCFEVRLLDEGGVRIFVWSTKVYLAKDVPPEDLRREPFTAVLKAIADLVEDLPLKEYEIRQCTVILILVRPHDPRETSKSILHGEGFRVDGLLAGDAF